MWYLLLNNRAFCIYLFLCKASLPTCRGSTDKAASNSWILETAVFKFGLRFLGAAYSYRLPPASTGLRFHSRCSHMPYPTYWHMAGGGGVLSGQTQNARHTSCKPLSTQITTSSHPAKDYKGKETKLKVLEKEKILSGHSLCYYNCYVRQIGKSIETSCHRGLPKAILPLPFQGHCPWLFLLAGLQVPSFGLLAHKFFLHCSRQAISISKPGYQQLWSR